MDKKATFTLNKRISSMLQVDLRRMFTMPLYYIMVGISLIIPILVLVMTTMMSKNPSIDPVTGNETIMEGFETVWQAIAQISGNGGMSMDLVSMCNIDMIYFLIAVLVCVFVSQEFQSGYTKNLFTMRSSKIEYVFSKTIVGVIGGISMILAYVIGALLGGAIANLSFAFDGVNLTNIIMCILTKILLVGIFVPIFLVMSSVGKKKLWLSIICSIGVGMLLFSMVSMISPLDSTIINVIISLLCSLIFSFGLGLVSNIILKNTSLV